MLSTSRTFLHPFPESQMNRNPRHEHFTMAAESAKPLERACAFDGSVGEEEEGRERVFVIRIGQQ